MDRVIADVGTSLATEESVPAAIALASLLVDNNPWLVIRAAASLGGDSDTIAAMAGAIAGAVAGAGALPAAPVEVLAGANPGLTSTLDRLTDGLLALRHNNSGPSLMSPRLVSTGSILVDVVVDVPHLPERGGDVLATGPRSAAGGGFNVVAAAARQGLRCRWVGRHGSGSYGDLVRAALAAEGVEVALSGPPRTELTATTRPTRDADTGVCFVLLEPDGERTFVTCAGVDAELAGADLAEQSLDAEDLVYVSGYDLAYPVSGPPLSAWVAGLGPGPRVVLDPGPLVGEIPAERLAPVLGRTDLLTVNAREAAWLSGVPEGSATTFAALQAAVGRPGPDLRTPRGRRLHDQRPGRRAGRPSGVRREGDRRHRRRRRPHRRADRWSGRGSRPGLGGPASQRRRGARGHPARRRHRADPGRDRRLPGLSCAGGVVGRGRSVTVPSGRPARWRTGRRPAAE